MAIYTVHAPSLRECDCASDPERFVFVRDGFYFWAFLLAPVWMLVRRLWLALLLYAVLSVALAFSFAIFDVPSGARFIASLLIGVLVGIEAATIRRWTLGRRGWRTVGTVVGDDLETAERRFFAAWGDSAAREKPEATSPAPYSPVRRVANPDVIGLFPEPGSSR